MNLFEKIHNYQLLSRLDEAEVYPVTAQEKAWLHHMLQKPSAVDFFAPDTMQKLFELLGGTEATEAEQVMEKAASQGKHDWHPLVRELRRVILAKNHLYVTAVSKNGRIFRHQRGVPYKLEYSLVKKAWYLIWMTIPANQLLWTPLAQIRTAEEVYVEDEWYDSSLPIIQQCIAKRRRTAKIQIVRRYQAELQRILYAFSCFDKEVEYAPDADTYTVTLHYMADEQEYILSRIRFLGLRVKVVENDELKRRMAESAAKALGRYRDSKQS